MGNEALAGITQETIDLTKQALSKATTTGITIATGLQAYPLEAPAKSLYPVLTPLRNRIPRLPGEGNAWHWKKITAINAGNAKASVAEGTRNSFIQYSETDVTVPFKTFGLDGKETDEAVWQGRGFEDIRARGALSVLQSVMIEEEKLILGGVATAGAGGVLGVLGTTPTPTLSAGGSGNTLPGAPTTYSVICVALPLYGYLNSTLAGLGDHAAKSVAATQAITLGQALSCTVTPVNGAVAYAWYVGTAGNEKLERITTINSAIFTAPLAGTGQAATAITTDTSADLNAFDGLLPQIVASGSGAYVSTLATGTAGTGTALTSDSAGGIVEIDAMLKSIYDNARVSPSVIWVSSQEALNITKKVINGGAASILRLTTTSDGMANLQAGARVGSYLNKFMQVLIPIIVHPYLPPGTLFAFAEDLPYPNNNVPNVVAMRVLSEYADYEFARTARQYEHGVYASAVLQHYFPAGSGLICNIANG